MIGRFPGIVRLAALLLGIGAPAAGEAAGVDIYVSDTPDKAIYRFAGDHVAATFSSQTIRPTGLALDGAGTLYASDLNQGSVYKYSADGSPSIFADGFAHPFGLAFDHAGNLFVAAVDDWSGQGTVVKITPAGERSVFARGLKRVRGLAFDAPGNLYVSDLDGGCVYKIAPDGTRSVFAGGIHDPTGLAFDPSGNLFVCSPRDGILKITPAGVAGTFTTHITDPRWLAFDPAGNLFVTDVGNADATPGHGWVYMFTPGGDRDAYAGNLSYPTGIAIRATPGSLANDSDGEAVSTVGGDGRLTLNLGGDAGSKPGQPAKKSQTSPAPK